MTQETTFHCDAPDCAVTARSVRGPYDRWIILDLAVTETPFYNSTLGPRQERHVLHFHSEECLAAWLGAWQKRKS